MSASKSQTPASPEIISGCVDDLEALVKRHMQAAAAISRLAIRLGRGVDPIHVVSAMRQHAGAGMPGAEELADMIEVIEGTQPAKWRERRANDRRTMRLGTIKRRLEWGKDAGPAPDWKYEPIMAAARQRRDVLGAAIALCEQNINPDGNICGALGNYLEGAKAIDDVERVLIGLGFSVEGAKIIPLAPRRRAGGAA